MSGPDVQMGCRLLIASLEMRLERLLKDVREFRRTVERLDTLAAIRQRIEKLKGEGK